MESITLAMLYNYLSTYAFIGIISFIGAAVGDIITTITDKDNNARISRIFASGMVGSAISYGISDVVIDSIGMKGFISFCFFTGFIGFGLACKLHNTDWWVEFIKQKFNILKIASNLEKEIDTNKDKKDEN